MRQPGLLLDDNRNVSKTCVTRPLVETGDVVTQVAADDVENYLSKRI